MVNILLNDFERERKIENTLHKATSEAISLRVDWAKIQVVKNKSLNICTDLVKMLFN